MRITGVLPVLALAVLACRPESNGSDVNYTTNRSREVLREASLLPIIHDGNGILDACVATYSSEGPTAGDPRTEERALEIARLTLNQWLSFLRSNPEWRGPTQVVFRRLSVADCEQRSNALALILGREDFWTMLREKLPGMRSFAAIEKHLIALEPQHWSSERVVAHEMGHLLGMGDVYDEAEGPSSSRTGYEGYNPPSIMGVSTTAGEMTFSTDDMRGINAVWLHIKKDAPLCGDGYALNTNAASYTTDEQGNRVLLEAPHCMPQGVVPATAASSVQLPNGTTAITPPSCPAGQTLNPRSGLCFPQVETVGVVCLARNFVFDPVSGYCCPESGMMFDPSQNRCVRKVMPSSSARATRSTNASGETAPIPATRP